MLSPEKAEAHLPMNEWFFTMVNESENHLQLECSTINFQIDCNIMQPGHNSWMKKKKNQDKARKCLQCGDASPQNTDGFLKNVEKTKHQERPWL